MAGSSVVRSNTPYLCASRFIHCVAALVPRRRNAMDEPCAHSRVHPVACDTGIAPATATPVSSRGEVEERSLSSPGAGSGEQRGSRGRVRNDSPGRQRRRSAPCALLSAVRPGPLAAQAPRWRRGVPGQHPGRRRKLASRRSRSASFLLSINPARPQSGREIEARSPHRIVRR